MANNDDSTLRGGLDIRRVLAELEVPFPPDQVHWRVMNTSNDKKRGQIVPYADPRAYTDRLNALFSPQGWTRTYRVETMNNITRVKKGETIVSGKVLVTCTVTIAGLGSHSATGEDWGDNDNGFTAADAQAFKRACCQFGLGRYFYDFAPPWLDLDQNRQPRKTPLLPVWAIPENWRQGMRPPGRNGNGRAPGFRNRGANGNNGTGTPPYLKPVRAMAQTVNSTEQAFRFLAMAMPLPERPMARTAPRMVISTRGSCRWKPRLARRSTVTSCASMAASIIPS